MRIQNRLKIMSFLQYFIWGCWLVTLGSYMMNTLGFTGAQVGIVYSCKGLAALIMPSLIGVIADKWVPANRLYTLCHFISAGTFILAATVSDPTLMFWVIFVNMMTYMPTIALSNTVSYYCLEKNNIDTVNFPRIRVFGTVGFIVAMWTISILGFELSNMQLYIAGGAALILTLYSLTLPTVPTANKKKNQTWVSMLGLDAFILLKQPKMALFFLFAMLLGAVLQVTNTFGNPFLHDFAINPEYANSFVVKYPSILLSVSQMAEVVFILAIPFFLKRFGIKVVMLMSMFAWTLRFGFFAFGDPSPGGFVLLTLSMLVYGIAFDFFNISGSMYIEQSVSSDIRASAQGLFMTAVNGIGAYVGAIVSGKVVDYFTVEGIREWQTIWLIFAAYALVLGIVFFFTFHHKHDREKFADAEVKH